VRPPRTLAEAADIALGVAHQARVYNPTRVHPYQADAIEQLARFALALLDAAARDPGAPLTSALTPPEEAETP
jgi:hypothetical protein